MRTTYLHVCACLTPSYLRLLVPPFCIVRRSLVPHFELSGAQVSHLKCADLRLVGSPVGAPSFDQLR